MKIKAIILNSMPIGQGAMPYVEFCHYNCPPSNTRCEHGEYSTIVLGGIRYEIVVESRDHVMFRECIGKNKIIFTREYGDLWNCQITTNLGQTSSNSFSRISRAHDSIKFILEKYQEDIYWE